MKKSTQTADSLSIESAQPIQHELQQLEPSRLHSEKRTLRGSWLSIFIYAIIFAALGGTYYLSKLQFFAAGTTLTSYGERLLLCGLLIVALLALEKLIRILLIGKISDDVSRYNVTQLVHFFLGLAIVATALSTLLRDWTTAVVSLGLISLVLGLALQTPLTNLFAWFYILIRVPYRIGDRMKIGIASGDVIRIGIFDTTLWEFGGEYLTTDHPSGRIIKFPNSLVLTTPVYNYSWPLFPYIWNEIKFYVAYQSDLNFISDTMVEIAQMEIGDAMRERVATYRVLLAQTPVDEIEVTEKPLVLFRASDNGHIEAIVRYLVPPKQAGKVKAALTRKMLDRLNQHPERVLFPKP